MCYSAQVVADYRKYVRMFGAAMSIREFVEVFWHRRDDLNLKLPKAMEAAFEHPRTESEAQIKALIDEYMAAQKMRFEQELFKQKTRLAAIGAAVAKINHDLRNSLATAMLASDRLADVDDPEVRRVVPRLYTSIDRAVELCSQTLNYVGGAEARSEEHTSELQSR